MRAEGKAFGFGKIGSVEEAITFTTKLLQPWDKWMVFKKAFALHYEDLLIDTVSYIQLLADFLMLQFNKSNL